MRKARLCYDHLAGELGVLVYEGLVRRDALTLIDGELRLSAVGHALFDDFGLDLGRLAQHRRVLCRACLDWSERRMHLAGSLGAALLARLVGLRYARRLPGSRAIALSSAGERFVERLTL